MKRAAGVFIFLFGCLLLSGPVLSGGEAESADDSASILLSNPRLAEAVRRREFFKQEREKRLAAMKARLEEYTKVAEAKEGRAAAVASAVSSTSETLGKLAVEIWRERSNLSTNPIEIAFKAYREGDNSKTPVEGAVLSYHIQGSTEQDEFGPQFGDVSSGAKIRWGLSPLDFDYIDTYIDAYPDVKPNLFAPRIEVIARADNYIASNTLTEGFLFVCKDLESAKDLYKFFPPYGLRSDYTVGSLLKEPVTDGKENFLVGIDDGSFEDQGEWLYMDIAGSELLDTIFHGRIQEWLGELHRAGFTFTIGATYRPLARAELMGSLVNKNDVYTKNTFRGDSVIKKAGINIEFSNNQAKGYLKTLYNIAAGGVNCVVREDHCQNDRDLMSAVSRPVHHPASTSIDITFTYGDVTYVNANMKIETKFNPPFTVHRPFIIVDPDTSDEYVLTDDSCETITITTMKEFLEYAREFGIWQKHDANNLSDNWATTDAPHWDKRTFKKMTVANKGTTALGSSVADSVRLASDCYKLTVPAGLPLLVLNVQETGIPLDSMAAASAVADSPANGRHVAMLADVSSENSYSPDYDGSLILGVNPPSANDWPASAHGAIHRETVFAGGLHRIVIANPTGGTYWIRLDPVAGGCSYRLTASTELPTNQRDFNGDGKADVVFRNVASHGTAAWYMNGNSRDGAAEFPAADPLWKIQDIGDFDNDGHADILWRHATTHQPAIWFMNGTVKSRAANPANPGPEWRVAAVADFDNDKHADILWQHRTTHQLAIWFMDGATRRTAGNVIPNPGGIYRVVGAADFDNNGRADILFQHRGTGALAVWTMNGAQRVASRGLVPVPPADWEAIEAADYYGGGDTASIIFRNVNTHALVIWRYRNFVRESSAQVATVPTRHWEVGNNRVIRP